MDAIKRLKQTEWFKKIKFSLFLNTGLALTAVGIAVFKTPNHFAFGGTSGISILLAAAFPGLDVGTAMWLVNAVLVGMGLCVLGRRVMGWTVYSSFALSFYVSLCERLWPMPAPLTGDTFLEMCFAVLLPAVGSAVVFDVGASTGGTDIVAMVLSKYTSLEIGKALLCSDFVITLLAAWMFGPATGLYCILGLVAKAFVVDGVIDNINQHKVCTVISSRSGQVKTFILEKLHRSATVQKALGAYTNQEEEVLMTVLNRREAARLRAYLRQVDPQAFITIVSSSEIIGKGFRSI